MKIQKEEVKDGGNVLLHWSIFSGIILLIILSVAVKLIYDYGIETFVQGLLIGIISLYFVWLLLFHDTSNDDTPF